jgi:hypothetical protein
LTKLDARLDAAETPGSLAGALRVVWRTDAIAFRRAVDCGATPAGRDRRGL